MRIPGLVVRVLFLTCFPLISHAGVDECAIPDLAIPDDDLGGVADTITVTAPGEVVSDMQILVDISHSFIGELMVTLENHEGRNIVLFDDSSCSGEDMLATYHDGAADPVQTKCNVAPPAVDGEVLPFEAIANLEGAVWDGNWILRVYDFASGDTGILNTWCMNATTILNDPPAAAFQAECDALICDFTDQSTDGDGTVSSWHWDFGDGETSQQQNPQHVYAFDDVYSVSLQVVDDDLSIDRTDRMVDAGVLPPVAHFGHDCSGLFCSFQDLSSAREGSLVGWNWDFGDGTGSSLPSPDHQYTAPGMYTVTLQVTDSHANKKATSELIEVGLNVRPEAIPQTVETYEDTSLPIELGGSDPDGDPLEFGIFEAPQFGNVLFGEEGEPSSSVTYHPLSNYHGPDSFQFYADDGEYQSDPATVSITVQPVNDPPRFSPGVDPVWLPGAAGPKSHPQWAQHLSPGPEDTENDQGLLGFTVNLIDPGGVIAPPGLVAGPRGGDEMPVTMLVDGTLNYALSGASGTAQLSITLKDDGGTENGGDDTSAPRIANISVMHDPSSLPPASYAWSMQLPPLYPTAEACCFDYDGDTLPDNAFGDLAAAIGSLAGIDANEAMAEQIETGALTKLLFWGEPVLKGPSSPFPLEFGNGWWEGSADFTDRFAGLGDFAYDAGALDGHPRSVLECSEDSPGVIDCTGAYLALPITASPGGTGLAETGISTVRMQGEYSAARPDCNGLCSVDETDSEPPLVHGGFRIGGLVHLDDYFSALNESFQSCLCFGNGEVQLFEYGESPPDYEFSCTSEGEDAAQNCPACVDIQLGMMCSLGGILLVNAADIDTNGNGVNDSMSIGIRLGASGANIVGCHGEGCVEKPDGIFDSSFEAKEGIPQ